MLLFVMNVTEAYDTHTHTEKGEEKLRFYVGIQIDGKIPKYNWIRKSWDCLLSMASNSWNRLISLTFLHSTWLFIWCALFFLSWSISNAKMMDENRSLPLTAKAWAGRKIQMYRRRIVTVTSSLYYLWRSIGLFVKCPIDFDLYAISCNRI